MFSESSGDMLTALATARSWWLKIWTGSYEAGDKAIRDQHQYGYAVGIQHNMFHLAPNTTSSAPEHSLGFYLGIYVLLAVGGALVSTSRYFYVFCGSIVASRKLFQKINFVVLRAPLRWLDTVPVGRILNRFTADFNTVDNSLAISVASCAGNLLNFCGIVVAAFIVHPLTLPLAAVLFAICFRIGIMYLNCARPVKRLESTTKSPVFEQFGSALTGVSTIRGFDKTQVYIDRMYERIDDFSTATFHLWLLNRWMGWRMALVGTLFATLIAALILLTPNMDSALAGFALAFALDFTVTVIWVIRTYANLELNMNAAERIIEYTELPTEPLDGAAPPAAWPTEGRVEVNELIVGYAPDLPAVLKGVSFVVERNQRVGVVGRTGAGKSSLTLAIFRFLEARSGSILIDGLDISKINLHDLRSRLAIIPQVKPGETIFACENFSY